MKDSIKLEAIAVIGVLAGVFYLWGWIYFANYYNYYGLPYSFAGNFHAQTLMIAGATEFTDMIEKFMGWLIGIFFLLVILHYTIPPGLKQKISVLYAAILTGIFSILFCSWRCMLCFLKLHVIMCGMTLSKTVRNKRSS